MVVAFTTKNMSFQCITSQKTQKNSLIFHDNEKDLTFMKKYF